MTRSSAANGVDAGFERTIAARMRECPDAVALDDGGRRVSYAELDRRVDAIAGRLIQCGVGPGARVAVRLNRGADLIASLLAVVRAGAAFVPIDPDYPLLRQALIMEDALPPVIVSSRVLPAIPGLVDGCAVAADLFIEDADQWEAVAVPERAAVAGQIACVLYTSGSTGRPKGVLSTVAGITNNLRWLIDYLPMRADDRVLQQTSYSFDTAAWELFAPLMAGARIMFTGTSGARDQRAVARIAADARVTIVNGVPSVLRLLVREPDAARCSDVRHVLSAGEALSGALRDEIHARFPAALLHNLYGPAEAAITVTAYTCDRADRDANVSIGKAIPNTKAYVLDDALQIAPAGTPGEIYLGGVCVAEGYLNRPELTAQRFVRDPFSDTTGARMYRTGDVGSYRAPEGSIEYLGRADDQVKIGGVRIEPAEVEAVIGEDDAIVDALVAKQTTNGMHRLVAFIVVEDGRDIDEAALADRIRGRLPSAFVPSVFARVPAIPLSPNGKADKTALLASLESRATNPPSPPGTVQDAIGSIWEELLNVAPVGPQDDFFAIGGTSLGAMQMVQLVEERTGLRPTIGALYANPKLADFARVVTTGLSSTYLTPLRHGAPGRAALFWFFVAWPGATGSVQPDDLERYLDPDLPIYMVATMSQRESESMPPVDEVVTRILAEIREVQPLGPYHFAGYCAGGVFAAEAARQLAAAGQRVELLTLVNALGRYKPNRILLRIGIRLERLAALTPWYTRAGYSSPLDYVASVAGETTRAVFRRGPRWFFKSVVAFAARDLRRLALRGAVQPGHVEPAMLVADGTGNAEAAGETVSGLWQSYLAAFQRFMPRPYSGPVTLFIGDGASTGIPWSNMEESWKSLGATVEVRRVRGGNVPRGDDFRPIADLVNTQMRAAVAPRS